MKNLAIILVLAFAGWKLYQSREHVPVVEMTGSAGAQYAVPSTAAGFRCDGRQYCSQMHSRAEAEFFIRNCPDTRMDGDRDGIPCENDSRF